MGHNGSGKSVFLKTLSGEMDSDAGPVSIQIDGVKISAKLGYPAIVPQNADSILATELTVRENLIIRANTWTLFEMLAPHKAKASFVTEKLAQHAPLLEKADSICVQAVGAVNPGDAVVLPAVSSRYVPFHVAKFTVPDTPLRIKAGVVVKEYRFEMNCCVPVAFVDNGPAPCGTLLKLAFATEQILL